MKVKWCIRCKKLYNKDTQIAVFRDNKKDSWQSFIRKQYCDECREIVNQENKARWAQDRRKSNRERMAAVKAERDSANAITQKTREILAVMEEKQNEMQEYINTLEIQLARLKGE